MSTTTSTSTTKRNTCSRHSVCEEDGYFEEDDCHADFCQCWQGWGWVMSCMSPLKFDETLPGCRWEEDVPSCRSTCDSLCQGLENVFVAAGCCSDSYCYCSSENDNPELLCDSGTTFCPNLARCVEGCSESECCLQTTTTTSTTTTTTTSTTTTSTTTTTTSTTTTTITTTTETTTTTTAETTTTTTGSVCDSLCAGFDDGVFASEDCCSDSYCFCSEINGNPSYNCSAGMGFCPKSELCVENCFESGCCILSTTIHETTTHNYNTTSSSSTDSTTTTTGTTTTTLSSTSTR